MDIIYENSRGMNVGREIYEYLSLEDMESMIKLRPARANYDEILPVYKRKLETSYSKASVASLLALAPLNEDNLYDFVTKIQAAREGGVGDLAARAENAGGGLVLAELAKMVLTDKIRKMVEMMSSWFQDTELDVEVDPNILETIGQVRDVLLRSGFAVIFNVLYFPFYAASLEGTFSITFDRKERDSLLAFVYQSRAGSEVFSPFPADITQRSMKKLAADVLEKMKQEYGEFVWIKWDDVDACIGDLVSILMRPW